MATTIVTRNFQITLPRDVREKEDIHIGDRILVTAKEDSIELRKLSTEDALNAFGCWEKVSESSVSTVRKIREESEQRLRRLGL